jgi:DNA repair protein RadC
MGYPLVAPDSLIQRFFQRLGWLQADETGRKRMPEQVVGAMLELASCGAPVREVAFVIRAFCGGENGLAPVASPCADEPNCSECPANSFCRTGSGRSDRAELPHDADISGAAVHSRRGEMRQLADNDLLELIARAASRTDAERASLTGAVASQSVRRGDLRHAELMALPSVSDAGALALCAAAELARRAQSEDGDRAAPLSEARLVFERYRRDFKNLQHEEVHVISTDIKHRPLRDNLVSRGGLAESLANPREIFRDAVRDAAYGIIAVHNHPSGDPSPSRKDVLLTVRLARAGSLLGIHLIDHVIVGSRSYFSFEESGLLAQLLPEGDHE